MNKNKMTILFGIILIIIGLVFVISPKGVFESIVLFVGITVIVYSVCSILVSVFGKNYSSYFITSSIIGLIFGIILVSNTDGAVKIVPILLGLWLFISGLSTTLLMYKAGSRLSLMTSPITRMILGLICFMTPVIPIAFVGIFIGVLLMLSGVNVITNSKNEEIVYKVRVKK